MIRQVHAMTDIIPSMKTTALKDMAFSDLERELAMTRRVLERLPEDQFGWKVHGKSMPLGNLALHVANLVQWMRDTLEKDELDLETTPAMRTETTGLADVLETFDRNVAVLRDVMERTDDASLARNW